MMTSPTSETLLLADGRRLAYLRMGVPGSRPVLFCHGTPGSRLFRPPDSIPVDLGVDFVTVDRPGYGRSTDQPHRTLLDWPADVAALADAFSWRRFAVIGISGGGPHALACAARLPERVAAVGLVSSVAPFWPEALRGMLPTTRRGFQLARWAPWLLRTAARQAARHPDRFLDRLRHELPDCDRQILARPDVARISAENLPAALAGNAMARELTLLRRDWGFDLAALTIPTRLWHGASDRNVPVAHGHRLAASLPACRPTFLAGAGHYLIFDQWAAILASLAESPT